MNNTLLPPFDINTNPTSVGVTRKKWVQRSDTFLVAFNIEDEKDRKLHCYIMVVKNCMIFMYIK